jgi:hypothetical protein
VLRYLHLIFDSKVYSIEEMKDPKKMMMDELHGILTAYETRIEKENPTRKEATLKASKNTKGKKLCYFSSHELDIEEAQSVRNIKRGFGKHKVKLPFICFNCGRVRHFNAKFPYEKMEDNGDEDNNIKEEHYNRSKYYRHKRGKYTKKKSF